MGQSAVLTLGAEPMEPGDLGHFGFLKVCDNKGQEAITLSGLTGVVSSKGADCAERFQVAVGSEADPGMVVVLDDDGKLRPCDKAYDRRVAGVVSGANGCMPGIVLNDQPGDTGAVPIALSGRVHCKVDADYGAISIGDPLTTSPTMACAMLARDRERAWGAMIGKALEPVTSGQALVPVLVSLQ